MKQSLVRISATTEKEIDSYCEEHGLAFATAIRCIVEEYFTIQRILKLTDEQRKQIKKARLSVS